MPWLRISSRFQPAPTPNSSRPPVSRSTLAAAFAVTIGSRSITRQIPVPSLIRSVAAPAAIRATNGSWMCEYSHGSSVPAGYGVSRDGRDVGVVGEEQRLERPLLDHPRQRRPGRCPRRSGSSRRRTSSTRGRARAAGRRSASALHRAADQRAAGPTASREGVVVLVEQGRRTSSAPPAPPARPARTSASTAETSPRCGRPGSWSSATRAGSPSGFHIWCAAPRGISSSSPALSSRSLRRRPAPGSRPRAPGSCSSWAGCRCFGGAAAAGAVGRLDLEPLRRPSRRSHRLAVGQLQGLAHASAALDLVGDQLAPARA